MQYKFKKFSSIDEKVTMIFLCCSKVHYPFMGEYLFVYITKGHEIPVWVNQHLGLSNDIN